MKGDNKMRVRLFLLLLILSLSLCPVIYAKSVYQVCYDYAYEGGIAQGQSDRNKGYSYSPEVALGEFPTQMIIKALKQKIGHSEDEVDRGFRDGYFEGYKKGYYNR